MHFLLRKRTCTHHHASVHEHTHKCLPSACFLAVLVSSGIASALALTSWSFLLCFPGLCVLSVWLFCVFSWVSPFLCWRLPWLSHAPWLCWCLRIGPEALCAWGGLGPVRGRDVGAGRVLSGPEGEPWSGLNCLLRRSSQCPPPLCVSLKFLRFSRVECSSFPSGRSVPFYPSSGSSERERGKELRVP